MLYYRRKLLLAILEVFGGRLSAIQMQKYLFLVTRRQEDKSFYFVPYKYGCFSFQANQDLTTLGTYAYLKVEDREYSLTEKGLGFVSQISLFDQKHIYDVFSDFGLLSQENLIRYTYVNYPFYAINSSIATDLLTADEMRKVNAQRRIKREKQLCTIGYEGVTLEQFINKLLIEDIHVLCDVRKNAYSQKYGFSKSQLEKACHGVDIEYVHVPDLGISTDKRQNLRSQQDYDKLFSNYERTILPCQTTSLDFIYNLIKKKGRVALTCFERDPKQCHRTRIANALMRYTNRDYTLKHIIF